MRKTVKKLLKETGFHGSGKSETVARMNKDYRTYGSRPRKSNMRLMGYGMKDSKGISF